PVSFMLPRHPPSSRPPYTTLFRSTWKPLPAAPRPRFERHGVFHNRGEVPSRSPTPPPESVLPPSPAGIFSPAPHLFQCISGILRDRKSTRLNSSHVSISYAVFCLK